MLLKIKAIPKDRLIRINLFSVNKQLNDKERVAAAMEVNSLLDAVNKCLSQRA
jgi:hypothetical protein